MNKRLQSLLDWILATAPYFLLIFIPLYPKLPLIDIKFTWVYIRAEDFILAVILSLYLLRRILGRAGPQNNPLTGPVILYWSVGLLSTIVSMLFIGKSIAHYFPQLVILHYVRRIEYIGVFFVAASSIRSSRRLTIFLFVFGVTLLVVGLYGVGQKFMSFPAFLTMNEEFAKGAPLILSRTSRLASTFAGHYDLAAYLAFSISLFGSIVLGLKKRFVQIAIAAVCALSFVVLLWTASRVSLVALAVSVIYVLMRHKKFNLVVPLVIGMVILVLFAASSSERFAKTFRYRRVVYDNRAGAPIGAVHIDNQGFITLEESASPALENLPIGSGFLRVPVKPAAPSIASFVVTALRQREDYPLSDIPPSTGEELQMAMERGQMYLSLVSPVSTSSGEVVSVNNRFFLDRALTYDISITTRLQGQWPHAWQAFSRNVLLGSGYSVLSLASDSDYFRALGETGIAGFFTFFFIFIAYFFFTRSAVRQAPGFFAHMAIGTEAGLITLLITAFFLDIFEASKMAYVLWLTMGASVGVLLSTYQKPFLLWPRIRAVLTHPLCFIGLLTTFGFVLFSNSTNTYFIGDDYTWLRWAQSATIADISRYFTDSAGFFYRPLSKLYFLVGYAFFWYKPGGYHVVNIFLHIVATSLLYLIIKKTVRQNWIALVSSLSFLGLAIHHENILWISGVSSLAGSTSALLSIYLFLRFLDHSRRLRPIWFVTSIITMILALFWYEGMLAMPLVLLVAAVLFGTKKDRAMSLISLLTIPLYWWMRTLAHAVSPSGNYGINLFMLPMNIVGNAVGYIIMTLFGPYTAEALMGLRSIARENKLISMGLVGVVVVALIMTRYRWRKIPSLSKATIFWLSVFVLSLVPYIGLGNISERYGYIASGALVVMACFMIRRLWQSSRISRNIWARIAVVTIVITLIVSNWIQLKGTMRDWEWAGKTSEDVLQTIRKAYFPLPQGSSLILVGVPLRMARAWLFPVGLVDAMDHVFADSSVRIFSVPTLEAAMSLRSSLTGSVRIIKMEGNNVSEVF